MSEMIDDSYMNISEYLPETQRLIFFKTKRNIV